MTKVGLAEIAVLCTLLIILLWPLVKDGWKSVWCSWRSTVWTYGMCSGRVARKHVGTGEVQHIIWKAGEQGHVEDCWIRFDSSWYPNFIPWRD